jgi:hypothetical protein
MATILFSYTQLPPSDRDDKLRQMWLKVWRIHSWRNWRNSIFNKYIREYIQKFPDWSSGARTANGTAFCHYMQLYRYFVSQSSEFRRHNPLCCSLTSVYYCCCCCLFRYRLSPGTYGYTLIVLGLFFCNCCLETDIKGLNRTVKYAISTPRDVVNQDSAQRRHVVISEGREVFLFLRTDRCCYLQLVFARWSVYRASCNLKQNQWEG